jgi:hypothetical protein
MADPPDLARPVRPAAAHPDPRGPAARRQGIRRGRHEDARLGHHPDDRRGLLLPPQGRRDHADVAGAHHRAIEVGKKTITLKPDGDGLVTPNGPPLFPKGGRDGILSVDLGGKPTKVPLGVR